MISQFVDNISSTGIVPLIYDKLFHHAASWNYTQGIIATVVASNQLFYNFCLKIFFSKKHIPTCRNGTAMIVIPKPGKQANDIKLLQKIVISNRK